MAKVVKRRWVTDAASGLPRRDRLSCDYEACLPDALAGREVALEGRVAADVSEAEAALARFDLEVGVLAVHPYAVDSVAAGGRLSVDLLLEVHRRLLGGTRLEEHGGRLREVQIESSRLARRSSSQRRIERSFRTHGTKYSHASLSVSKKRSSFLNPRSE